MTATDTEPGDERCVLGWSALASRAAVGVLLAALILAHGLECAALLGHGASPIGHTLVAPAISADAMQHATAPDESEPMMLAALAADPVQTVGGPDMLARGGAVCVAVLIGAGIWLLGRRPRLICHSAPSWLSVRICMRLLAVARCRLSAPDLAVLGVLRT
ncbi:MAG: hypothetical protein ACR2J5_18335 [Geodermatophilaceae bacterium]